VLESKQPPDPIFRVARRPDPWQPPDWSRAQPDGTFGNRFDDPEGCYRVLYAASQKLSCFLETLARFRADLTLLAEFNEISGADDFFPLRKVPPEWCETRLLGTATATGQYADVCASVWVAALRRALAAECLELGVNDLDAAALQRDSPRRLTQLVSLEVYRRDYAGVYYRSRYGHELENWALFEPFSIVPGTSHEILRSDPDLIEALRILGIELSE
jgi:RES domain